MDEVEMMDWMTLDIAAPAERDAVCLALYHAGYTVRQRRRKDGNKRRSAEVVANQVYFGDSKREDSGDSCGGQGGYGGYSAPADGYPAQPDPDSDYAELTTADENLPF